MKLIAIIGDEETVFGFLLTGIGDFKKGDQSNFFVTNEETPVTAIEERFKKFISRDDIDVILITTTAAERIRHVIDSIDTPNNAAANVVEIPSNVCPLKEFVVAKESKVNTYKRITVGDND